MKAPNTTFAYSPDHVDGPDVLLEYFDHPYNTTVLNERAIEIPIADHWLKSQGWPDQGPKGLEVGNVLWHYGYFGHKVVDLTETEGSSLFLENIDVFDIDGEYDWILAISTLEHVYHDTPGPNGELDPNAAARAVIHLYDLLKPGGEMLFTVPGGYHPTFDKWLLDASESATVPNLNVLTYLREADSETEWYQAFFSQARSYGPWANSLFVCTMRKPEVQNV